MLTLRNISKGTSRISSTSAGSGTGLYICLSRSRATTGVTEIPRCRSRSKCIWIRIDAVRKNSDEIVASLPPRRTGREGRGLEHGKDPSRSPPWPPSGQSRRHPRPLPSLFRPGNATSPANNNLDTILRNPVWLEAKL